MTTNSMTTSLRLHSWRSSDVRPTMRIGSKDCGAISQQRWTPNKPVQKLAYPRHVWQSEINPGLAKYVDTAISQEEKNSTHEAPCPETFRGHLQNLIGGVQDGWWRLPKKVTKQEMI